MNCCELTYKLIMVYLICSINFAVIISKILNIPDPTKTGSGNAGATNVFRNNKLAGVATFFLDFLKGVISIQVFSKNLTQNDLMISNNIYLQISYTEIIGLFAIIGHILPIHKLFLKKKSSGKGVSTGFGVCMMIWPIGTMLISVFWAGMINFTKTSSISNILSLILWNIAAVNLNYTNFLFSVIFTLLIIASHKKNIKDLLAKKS